ncbi:MAG: DUF6062 family protein [Defluviitaleaceae bacterium]|nr:DUF6062 family protein [Defluviitaleaceae bacterium]
MKEYIHTIPVLEALRDPKDCAFCVMHNRIETHAIQFIMGPAYMEDDVRMETNRIGFCKNHLTRMYEEQNRLGLALMLHTHMQQLNKDIAAIISNKQKSPLFGKDTNGPLAKLQSHLELAASSCYVCRNVTRNFELYMGTFLHLWQKGGEESALIKDQKGYCLPHFTQLIAAACKLGRSKRERFIEEIVQPQMAHMCLLEGDLEWFTLKFDHRNANEPWKNAKDALLRALDILGGSK